MVEFLLRDRFPEPNSEEYDYVVTLDMQNTLYNREKTLYEIQDFINKIEEYDKSVVEYLQEHLESKHITYTIKAFKDMDTIYY